MASQPDAASLPRRTAMAPMSMLSRLPTGAKLFITLSVALLLLALIAIGATLQTGRTADAEARARLRIAANESARSIAIELVGDMTALRVAVTALQADAGDAPSCARAQGCSRSNRRSARAFRSSIAMADCCAANRSMPMSRWILARRSAQRSYPIAA